MKKIEKQPLGFNTPTHKWEDIRQAVVNRDKKTLKKIGMSYGKPILEQEGVTVEEVAQQILGMAPGKHPCLGPLLLDLADKL